MVVCVLQTKKRFAKEWADAEKATQQAEKTENDLNATRLDVDKVNTLILLLRLITDLFWFITRFYSESFHSVCLPLLAPSLHLFPHTSHVYISSPPFLRPFISPPFFHHSVFCTEGQAPCPCPHAHSGGVPKRLCGTTAEIQQGPKLLLLH